MEFCLWLQGESAGTDEVVQEVVSRQTAEILEGSSLEAFQEAFVAESAKLSLTHKAAALETQLLLHPQQRDRSLQAFLDDADIQGKPWLEPPRAAHFCRTDTRYAF